MTRGSSRYQRYPWLSTLPTLQERQSTSTTVASDYPRLMSFARHPYRGASLPHEGMREHHKACCKGVQCWVTKLHHIPTEMYLTMHKRAYRSHPLVDKACKAHEHAGDHEASVHFCRYNRVSRCMWKMILQRVAIVDVIGRHSMPCLGSGPSD